MAIEKREPEAGYWEDNVGIEALADLWYQVWGPRPYVKTEL